jgi:hypothetical protein
MAMVRALDHELEDVLEVFCCWGLEGFDCQWFGIATLLEELVNFMLPRSDCLSVACTRVFVGLKGREEGRGAVVRYLDWSNR